MPSRIAKTKRARSVQRKNGHDLSAKTKVKTQTGITPQLARMLRPQSPFQWLMPNIGAITPTYIEQTLRGGMAGSHIQQWELFQMMFDSWPELSACKQELTYGLMKKNLIFEPYCEENEKPTDSAVEKSKVVSAALRQMTPEIDRPDDNALEGTIGDILDGWFRGVSVIEVLWGLIDGGKLGMIRAPKATFFVNPTDYGFSQEGRIGLVDKSKGSGVSRMGFSAQPVKLIKFPEDKFLVGIHKSKSGTALAGPLLRPLAWWWCASNFASDWLLNLAQVFGLPFRWANYEANSPQETIDAICNMLQNMGSSGWAAFPIGTTMELKTPPGGNSSDHSPQGELLDRADRYCRTLILGQTMSGGSGTTGKGGGQAFGTVEEGVKDDRIDAAGRYVARVLNHQLVKSILALNYGETTEAPNARFLEDAEAELPEAQRDQTLVSMGMPIGVDYLRKKYDIPEPANDEEVVSGMSTGQKEAAEAKTEALKESAKAMGKPGEDKPNVEDDEPAKAKAASVDDIRRKAMKAWEKEFPGEKIQDAAAWWVDRHGNTIPVLEEHKEIAKYIPASERKSLESDGVGGGFDLGMARVSSEDRLEGGSKDIHVDNQKQPLTLPQKRAIEDLAAERGGEVLIEGDPRNAFYQGEGDDAEAGGHWVTINGRHVFIKSDDTRTIDEIIKDKPAKASEADPELKGHLEKIKKLRRAQEAAHSEVGEMRHENQKNPGQYDAETIMRAEQKAKEADRALYDELKREKRDPNFMYPGSCHWITWKGRHICIKTDYSGNPGVQSSELHAKNDDLDFYLGDLREDFVRAFKGDLTPLRGALEIALAKNTEAEQHEALIALQPKLPELLKTFIDKGISPQILAKAIAKGFSDGWHSEKTE